MRTNGTTEIAVPAIITCHGVESPSAVGSSEMATVRVYITLERIKSSGHSNSFQRTINDIDPQAASAGVIFGSTIFQKILNSLQPSIRACSITV